MPSVADWGGGMSASCKPRLQLFADAGSGWPQVCFVYKLPRVNGVLLWRTGQKLKELPAS